MGKKSLLFLITIFIMIFSFGLVACDNQPVVSEYYLDSNGNLVAEFEDGSTKDLGTLGDTIANGVEDIDINADGYYVINGIVTDIVAIEVYDVTFNTGFSANVSKQTIKDGYKVVRPEIERAGYTLNGWYCNGEEWRFNSDVVKNDMVLTADWAANEYTVSFDSNGGGEIDSFTIKTGEELILPIPEKPLYTFEGWLYNGIKVTSATLFDFATNINLVASWSRTQYTVTFDTAGGEAIEPIKVDSFSQILELPIPLKSEFEFLGWYVKGNKIELPYDFTEGNLTLTAHWRGISEDWEFIEDDNGTGIKLLNYKGNNVEVIVPTTLSGKPVTTIASNAFKNKTGLRRINFSNVINFEYKAISGCESLEEIELLGETNTTLVYIFGGESNIPNSLKEIIFSENSTTFGDWIFDEIVSATRTFTVYVNAKVAKAPKDAFYECNSIDKLYFSNTITTFDSRVICALPNLTYVDLPDNLKSVGMNNFINCPKLLYIIYPISLVSSDYGGLCASNSIILVESDSRPSGWISSAFSIYEEELNIFYGFEKLLETEDFLYALCKVGSTKRCVIIQRYNSNADYPEFIEGYPVTFTNNNYTKAK